MQQVAQMDKNISFLNKLKSRLNKYLHLENEKKEGRKQRNYNYTKLPTYDVANLRARMLAENVTSGMALESGFCDNSGAYIEFSIDGMFSFHIYPTMDRVNKREEPAFTESIEYLHKEKKSIAEQNPEIKVKFSP